MISWLAYVWDHFEEALGALLMGIMATLSFMNVVTRYVFNYSTAWTEELVIYLLVWATLLGTALAYRQGSNLMVAFIYREPLKIRFFVVDANINPSPSLTRWPDSHSWQSLFSFFPAF